ncbi:MAG: hypothetical protein C4555_02130 [Dehalococcoidia bacterium]|nr:MAG: hypothetical protein C4555_02130 [Dehalococcoidia bacterium]
MSLSLADSFAGCDALTVDKIEEKSIKMPRAEGSRVPSTGLSEYEIFSVVEEMGAYPLARHFEGGFERNKHLTLEQVIYPYVESCIPVMVTIETEGERHGLVVVGHTFDRDSWWQQAQKWYYPYLKGDVTWIPSYMWVPDFIVHDDNFGPYLSVPRTLLAATASHVVVPIPKICNAFLAGFEAESLVAGYLALPDLFDFVVNKTRTTGLWKKPLEQLRGSGNRSAQIVLRPLLVSRDALLKHVKESEFSRELYEAYQQTNLPAWMWLVEISLPELYAHRKKIGEMIINPSCAEPHIHTGLEPLLALRILDVMVRGHNFRAPLIIPDIYPMPVLLHSTFEHG